MTIRRRKARGKRKRERERGGEGKGGKDYELMTSCLSLFPLINTYLKVGEKEGGEKRGEGKKGRGTSPSGERKPAYSICSPSQFFLSLSNNEKILYKGGERRKGEEKGSVVGVSPNSSLYIHLSIAYGRKGDMRRERGKGEGEEKKEKKKGKKNASP